VQLGEIKMIEIYLFVNPLSERCFSTEKSLLDFIKNTQHRIQFRFVPLLNLRTVAQMLEKQGISSKDIHERNKLSQLLYSAALDYKAMELQGKKKGQEFLLELQHEVAIDHQSYSEDLVKKIAKKVGNLEMFLEDRRSSLVAETFQADQQMAQEMNIKTHPSAVVFNYECECDFGVLVEDCCKERIETIAALCNEDQNHATGTYREKPFTRDPFKHLHLVQ
jgi:predicted DsbA family dithiol-disulfide isomerase